jgi:hypothetical protein
MTLLQLAARLGFIESDCRFGTQILIQLVIVHHNHSEGSLTLRPPRNDIPSWIRLRSVVLALLESW